MIRLISKIFFLNLLIFVMNCASSQDSTQSDNKPATISSASNNPTPELRSIPNAPMADDGWGTGYKKVIDGKEINLDGMWYTKKYSGKANERSIELKSPSFMESSCKYSVLKGNSKTLVESALGSLGAQINPDKAKDLSKKIVKEQSKNFEISGCVPTSADKNFSECECYLSYKPEGGKEALIKYLN